MIFDFGFLIFDFDPWKAASHLNNVRDPDTVRSKIANQKSKMAGA